MKKIDEKLAQYGGLKGFNSHNAAIAAKIHKFKKKIVSCLKMQSNLLISRVMILKIRDAAITEVTYLGLVKKSL